MIWIEDEQAAGAEREADDHGVRDVPGEIAEAKKRDRELHDVHEEAPSSTAAWIFCSGSTMAMAESTAMEMALVGPLISCRDESNNARNRRHHNRGIQTVLHWKAGHERIGHRLRNGNSGSYGDSRDEVCPCVARAIPEQTAEDAGPSVGTTAERGRRHAFPLS
ncbi:MAG: hypothetical protein U0163_07530 [Gemmatimonadaceae bacterium]